MFLLIEVGKLCLNIGNICPFVWRKIVKKETLKIADLPVEEPYSGFCRWGVQFPPISGGERNGAIAREDIYFLVQKFKNSVIRTPVHKELTLTLFHFRSDKAKP